MEILKIKDNSQIKKEIFTKIPNLTNKISNKTLKQLESEGIFVFPEIIREAEDVTGDQIIIQSVNDTYRSSNVMGFIGCGDERLIIESRFSKNEKEDFFFHYLLEKVLDFPNIVNLNSDVNHDNRLLNFFLFLFPNYLKHAMRKGLFKTYICRDYNDNNVKGTIDIARHIKKNVPFIGKIAYSQREFSFDNSLTELIRHTIEFIKQKSYGKIILNKIKDEVKLIINATSGYEICERKKIIEINKKNTVKHAYFKEYLALQHLCILILQYQKHQMGSGSRQIYGILFDGAWLWEEYINLLIKDDFYHPMNKSNIGAQRLFNGKKTGLIYPDFIGKDIKDRVIADAKYKPFNNIGNKDYLQLLAYMFRFNSKKGFYLYPEAGDMEDMVLYMNQGITYENNVQPCTDICIIKHGLKIPNKADNYMEFSSKMNLSESEFKSVFN